jgi:arginyl-tRNA--protein-N-Asp/Glu arginylyltransferase
VLHDPLLSHGLIQGTLSPMTTQQAPDRFLTFHRSRPMPCPYLQGYIEQQLFTEISGPQARQTFDRLSAAGFRRSHHIAYRPSCKGCAACVPVRVIAGRFETSKRWRRVMAANTDLRAISVGKFISDEQFALFRRYVAGRHGDGDMARMTRRDYAAMVVTSPVETELVEFRMADGRLVAACLLDRLSDGLSAVYSFFDPRQTKRSLGSFMVLWMVEQARAHGLDHVYLGFWIEESPKMAYKDRFRPLEGFGPGGWQPIESFSKDRDKVA